MFIFEKGVDIEVIFAVYDSKNIYIGIKMVGFVKKFILYYFYIRVFENYKYFGRMYVLVFGSKMNVIKIMISFVFLV